jgi:hypothetical protein
MDLLAHVDSALEAAHMDAIDALRAFFLLAAATVRPPRGDQPSHHSPHQDKLTRLSSFGI